jgi:hypothetical protein
VGLGGERERGTWMEERERLEVEDGDGGVRCSGGAMRAFIICYAGHVHRS